MTTPLGRSPAHRSRARTVVLGGIVLVGYFLGARLGLVLRLPPATTSVLWPPNLFTKKRSGLGMGLSIARTIVHAHGGTISSADRPKGGAVFDLSFPLVLDEARGANPGPPVASVLPGAKA